jgi:hypothetical protein
MEWNERSVFRTASAALNSALSARSGDGAHGRAHGIRAAGAQLAEIGASRVGQHQREFVIPDLQNGIGHFIDGIVAHGDRGMAARIGRHDLVIDREFFAHMQRLLDHGAVPVGAPAAALVQRELGIDQVALVVGQPLRAVEGPARLLATGQRQFDGAFGRVSGLLPAGEQVDPVASIAFMSEVPRP